MNNKFVRISNSPNLKSLLLKLPNWNYEVVKIRNPKEKVVGLTSKTKDNFHILCLDYDGVDKKVVLMDILMLKEIIKPSLVFLLTSHEEKDELGICGNYMVLILDKFYFREVQQIMALTHSDSIHRLLADKSRYKAYVIRISKKGSRTPPKLLKSWNFKGKRENSLAHYLLLKRLYNFKVDVKKVKFDKYTETTLTYYNTASRIDNESLKEMMENAKK